MDQQSFEHQLPFLTAKITIQTDNKLGIGTGFFYKAPLNNETDSALILLISNKHVFINPKGRLVISLNRVKENGTPNLGNIINFDQMGFENAYFVHPDPDVDLACINVSSIEQIGVHYMHLHEIFLKPIDYEKVAPGSDVIFVGYPENRYDTVNNLPLIRKGSIASMPNIDFNGKDKLLLMRKFLRVQVVVLFLFTGTTNINYLALFHKQCFVIQNFRFYQRICHSIHPNLQ